MNKLGAQIPLSKDPEIRIWAAIAIASVCLLSAGCASKNVDPATPRAHTGYVDFYADDPELSWQVEEVHDAQDASQVFVQFTPLQERVLRLSFAPGHYQLRVAFLNRIVTQPAVVAVEVHEGMITPVRITLTEAGQTMLQTREARAGGTYYGRYGRGTKTRAEEETMYRVTAEPGGAIPFQRKANMPYGKPAGP